MNQELKNVPKKFVTNQELNDTSILKLGLDYPSPIVTHEEARLKALDFAENLIYTFP